MNGFAFTRRNLVSLAAVAAASAGGLGAFASNAAASGDTLTGAGSTLVYPFEQEWAQGFQNQYHDSVSYNAVGSGQGIADVTTRTVNFGASDAPLTTAQASACANGGSPCEQIPWAVTATGVGYNVPGAKRLKLTGTLLADIYLGSITNWNDPRIAAVNKGAHLPNLKITPIFRSDGSGDTYAFTNYLTDVSKAWASKVNYATSVQFRAGIGAKGNSGVVAAVESTKGSIGYAAVSYLIEPAEKALLGVVAVGNAAGKYEYPDLAQIEAAANTVKRVPGNLALHIVDPPKKAKVAYPISTFTYAIVPTSGNKEIGVLKAFIDYALTTGQRSGPSLDFAKLPKAVVSASKRAVASLS